MNLKVKDMDIATGGPLIAILNQKDARKLDLYVLDRVKIKKGRKIETAVVDIAESEKAVPRGRLGVFEEVIDSLGIKDKDEVEISIARKPLSLKIIKKKLDGETLTKKEIHQVIWDIVHNKLNDIELTYFISACYTEAMSQKETIMLTEAMAEKGQTLKLKKYPIIDKHCIGGVPGNRTTMILVPIIAAAGLTIPKTSSRSITSPAGTADTMEVLANVSFSLNRMKKIVQKTNGCIVWGGALNLAPADDKIIKVERPLGIDAESQLLASILAKKLSVSSTHIIIDIPAGRGAKVKDKQAALILKRQFENIAKKLKRHVRVTVTDGSQPIGNGIGPALEARDVLEVLMRDKKRPLDLERKCVMMAGEIFGMVGIKNGRKKAQHILDSGKAYMKMKEIIRAQGGNPDIAPREISRGRYRHLVRAKRSGTVRQIRNGAISHIARIAGAPKYKGAGLYLYGHVGDKVKKGDSLLKIYTNSVAKLRYVKEVLKELEPFQIK
ncbi:AMP phosphorylase [Candidatus Woesearchaeota archaeon]|nr:AMP phosphorylase [Candidatus Woesearchaeota archaeon]